MPCFNCIGHFQFPKTLTFNLRVFQNLGCDNELYLHENIKSFSYEWLHALPREIAQWLKDNIFPTVKSALLFCLSIRCIFILHIYVKGFLSRISFEISLFSFLSRVCSRSYHLRDDRQIFCHEFLRRYICVFRRVVPHSGEVRAFFQPPPRPRPSRFPRRENPGDEVLFKALRRAYTDHFPAVEREIRNPQRQFCSSLNWTVSNVPKTNAPLT